MVHGPTRCMGVCCGVLRVHPACARCLAGSRRGAAVCEHGQHCGMCLRVHTIHVCQHLPGCQVLHHTNNRCVADDVSAKPTTRCAMPQSCIHPCNYRMPCHHCNMQIIAVCQQPVCCPTHSSPSTNQPAVRTVLRAYRAVPGLLCQIATTTNLMYKLSHHANNTQAVSVLLCGCKDQNWRYLVLDNPPATAVHSFCAACQPHMPPAYPCRACHDQVLHMGAGSTPPACCWQLTGNPHAD
jgi:hypothetical protein